MLSLVEANDSLIFHLHFDRCFHFFYIVLLLYRSWYQASNEGPEWPLFLSFTIAMDIKIGIAETVIHKEELSYLFLTID